MKEVKIQVTEKCIKCGALRIYKVYKDGCSTRTITKLEGVTCKHKWTSQQKDETN
jgi:hypothetical protein